MAKERLPYTYSVKQGRYWRFRHDLYGDVRLPGQPGDAAFHEKYAEYLAVVEARRSVKPASKDSFEWLIGRYRQSPEFQALADRTQADYEQTLDILKDKLGAFRFAVTTRSMIKAVRDDFAATPRKAHKIKQMVSRLYSWADENDIVPAGFNPASTIKKLKQKGGPKEITVWSDFEIELFLKHCPVDLKTPVMLALYTGQRTNDVLQMTWTHYQGDMIRVRQSKTGAMLDIACHRELRRYLDSLTGKGIAICIRGDGTPWQPNPLVAALYRAVRSVEGMPHDRSMHGLRYAAGSRMEEAGCTVAQIEAVLGHRTMKMAMKYASQRLRAKEAVERLEGSK